MESRERLRRGGRGRKSQDERGRYERNIGGWEDREKEQMKGWENREKKR